MEQVDEAGPKTGRLSRALGAPWRALKAVWRALVVEPGETPPPGRRLGEVVLWWEDRRGRFNLFVLAVSILWALPTVVAVLIGGESAWSVLFIILVLQVFSNLWYTAGWLAEVPIRIVLRDRLLWLGPVAFWAGELFSFFFCGLFLGGRLSDLIPLPFGALP